MTDFTTRLATSLLAAQTAPDGVAKFLGFSSLTSGEQTHAQINSNWLRA
jgi:hypothetical protein